MQQLQARSSAPYQEGPIGIEYREAGSPIPPGPPALKGKPLAPAPAPQPKNSGQKEPTPAPKGSHPPPFPPPPKKVKDTLSTEPKLQPRSLYNSISVFAKRGDTTVNYEMSPGEGMGMGIPLLSAPGHQMRNPHDQLFAKCGLLILAMVLIMGFGVVNLVGRGRARAPGHKSRNLDSEAFLVKWKLPGNIVSAPVPPVARNHEVKEAVLLSASVLRKDKEVGIGEDKNTPSVVVSMFPAVPPLEGDFNPADMLRG